MNKLTRLLMVSESSLVSPTSHAFKSLQETTPSSTDSKCKHLQAFYVPAAFVAIDLVTGKHWLSDVLGILVGHL